MHTVGINRAPASLASATLSIWEWNSKHQCTDCRPTSTASK